MARPRPTVTAPTPEPLGYGLLTCASEQLRVDDKARHGVRWDALAGTAGGVVPIDAVTGGRGALTPENYDDQVGAEGQLPVVETDPFLIYAGVRAKPVGLPGGVDDLSARAKMKLQLTAGRWIERGFQAQLNTSAAHTEIVGGAPVDPDVALGLLEEWIADVVGAHGVIHSPRRGAGLLTKHTSVSGVRQQTKLGTRVAFGTGYANQAPGGVPAAAGTVWVWATGPVVVNRSGIETLGAGAAAMTLSQNTAEVYATEVVSVGFEAGTVAVPVKFEVENP